MCVKCLGAGCVYTVDEDDLFADKSCALCNVFGEADTHYYRRIADFCTNSDLSPDQSIASLKWCQHIRSGKSMTSLVYGKNQ